MISQAKVYIDELAYFQTFLYEIQNQNFPNWREDIKLGITYDIDFLINEVKKFRECLCVNLKSNISFENLLLLVNEYESQVSEIVLLQFNLYNFICNHENFILVKSGVIFVFNFELFRKCKIAKKTMVSKCFKPFVLPDSQPWKLYFENIINNIEYISKHVHLNILLIPEVSTDEDLKRMLILDLPNTVFIGQKFIFKYATNIEFQYWFMHTAWVNVKSCLSDELNLNNPFKTKKLYFDCLFGHPSVLRKSFYEKLCKNELDKSSFVSTYNWPDIPNSISYPKKFLEVIKSQHPTMNFIQHPDYENRVIFVNLNHTIKTFKLDETQLSFSQMLDVDIYNHAAYSVIFETTITNMYLPSFFITEKICKPILAKRLFLVYGNKNYLSYLRSLGFKTFDGIINESYDSKNAQIEREDLIIEEMKKLTKIEQTEIYSKIRPIVEHNYNHLLMLLNEEKNIKLLEQFLT